MDRVKTSPSLNRISPAARELPKVSAIISQDNFYRMPAAADLSSLKDLFVTNIETELALLITAAVRPAQGIVVSRSNYEDREQDYVTSLTRHMREIPAVKRIVFIENSGWPLDRFRDIARENPHGKQIEFVSLPGGNFNASRGKSYAELALLRDGIAASVLAKQSRFLCKLTGRLFLENIEAILRKFPDNFDLACDLRDHSIYEILRLPYSGRHADCRFLAFTPEFFQASFLPGLDWVDDAQGRMIESWVYGLAKAGDKRNIVRRFAIEPEFRGISGALNRQYDRGTFAMRSRIRGITRLLLPWLHI